MKFSDLKIFTFILTLFSLTVFRGIEIETILFDNGTNLKAVFGWQFIPPRENKSSEEKRWPKLHLSRLKANL